MTIERRDWGPRSDGPRDTPGNSYPHLEPQRDVPASKVQDRSEGKISRPDWGPRTPPGGRETVDPLLTPQPSKPKAEAASSVSRAPAAKQVADDEERDSSDVTDAEIDAEIAAEELAAERNMLKAGFTLEEVARMRGKSPDEVGKSRLMTREAIEQQLGEIAAKRKADKAAYFKDQATQQRERQLIEMRNEVVERERQSDQVEATVSAILADVGEERAAQLEADVKTWPERARRAVRRVLEAPLPDPTRPASEADLDRFGATPEGAACLKAWGRNAPRKLAILRARLDDLMASGNEAALFFDGLPSADAAAMMKRLTD